MNLFLLASAIGAIALLSSTAAYAVPFMPPADNTAPGASTGGASRGSFFTPPDDSAAPRRAGGGASRGSFFTPPDDSPAPRRAGGGASRGSFFTPPADSPAPRRAAGGAARGESPEVPTPVAPATPQRELFPDESVQSMAPARGNEYGTGASPDSTFGMLGLMPQSFYGTTIAAHPTILVYLPASEAQEAVFSLKDEERNLRYYVTVPTSGKAGVYAFQMPADVPPLAVNANYQWFVALKREGSLTPGSPFVDGWIKRIEASPQLSASMAAALAEEDLLAQAKALGGAGVWYDTVAILALLRSQQPESEAIAAHWNELLTSVELQEISTVPLIADAAP